MNVSFKIGEEIFSVPEFISLSMFERAIAWDITDVKNHKPFVATITDCPIALLNLMDTDTFNLVLGVCVSLIDVTELEVYNTLGFFSLKNFDEFTFGDFIDIDIMVADGLTGHATEIASKIYDMPYNQMAEIDVKKVFPSLIAMSKFRERVYKEYDEFFDLGTRNEANDDIEMSINNLQLMWYEAVLVLADHHFLNIQHVVERPYKEALNFLTWKKNEIAKQQLENVKRKYTIK